MKAQAWLIPIACSTVTQTQGRQPHQYEQGVAGVECKPAEQSAQESLGQCPETQQAGRGHAMRAGGRRLAPLPLGNPRRWSKEYRPCNFLGTLSSSPRWPSDFPTQEPRPTVLLALCVATHPRVVPWLFRGPGWASQVCWAWWCVHSLASDSRWREPAQRKGTIGGHAIALWKKTKGLQSHHDDRDTDGVLKRRNERVSACGVGRNGQKSHLNSPGGSFNQILW